MKLLIHIAAGYADLFRIKDHQIERAKFDDYDPDTIQWEAVAEYKPTDT